MRSIISIVISILFFLCVPARLAAQGLQNQLKVYVIPAGGYRVLNSMNPTLDPQAFRSNERARFGIAAGFEYQRSLKKWVSVSAGIEYQYFEYGADEKTVISDTGGSFTYGRARTAYIHQFFGIPLKCYFNMVSKEKFRVYGMIGIVPKFCFYRRHRAQLFNEDNHLVSDYTDHDPPAAYPDNMGANIFRLEALVGFGVNFNFSPRFTGEAGIMGGYDLIQSNFGTPVNENIYRFGLNIGAGYLF